MSVYQVVKSAMQDPAAYIAVLQADFTFVRRQSGTRLDRAALAALIRGMAASGKVAVHDHRCLYENADILAEHCPPPPR